MLKENSKILLIRMDKIGDLVLSLGVDQHPGLKNHRVEWLIPSGLEFVLEASKPSRDFHPWNKSFSKENEGKLLSWLKRQNYDAAVFFQGEKWILRALKKAQIPIRCGQLSDIRSFFLLNRGVRQRRSSSDLSEFYLNQQLLEKGLGLNASDELEASVLEAQAELIPILQNQNYFVIHAGMGGSALNWNQESYISSIKLLLSKNKIIVLTGTDSDAKYLDKILGFVKQEAQVINLVGQLSAQELLKVLSEAEACLAPSTGVLHLAASLGVKSIGLYPPIHVQSKKRWGAKGKKVTNIEPQVECPEKFHCQGASCRFFPCMESISPEKVVGELLE